MSGADDGAAGGRVAMVRELTHVRRHINAALAALTSSRPDHAYARRELVYVLAGMPHLQTLIDALASEGDDNGIGR